MISIQAKLPGAKRLDKLVKELKYVSSSMFLQALHIGSFRDRALAALKDNFPERNPESIFNVMNSRRKKEYSGHLKEGFYVYPTLSSNGVGFTIDHKERNNPRIQEILKSLDTGSRGYRRYISAAEAERFFGIYNDVSKGIGWVTLSKRQIYMKKRKGLEYTDKTVQFIQLYLLPEMRNRIAQGIRNRLASV